MLNIEFSSSAKRFLKKSEKQLAKRIIEKIEKLSEDPFPSDVKRVIKRKEKTFRIRIGEHRVEYAVFYDKNEILIVDIKKRQRSY